MYRLIYATDKKNYKIIKKRCILSEKYKKLAVSGKYPIIFNKISGNFMHKN